MKKLIFILTAIIFYGKMGYSQEQADSCHWVTFDALGGEEMLYQDGRMYYVVEWYTDKEADSLYKKFMKNIHWVKKFFKKVRCDKRKIVENIELHDRAAPPFFHYRFSDRIQLTYDPVCRISPEKHFLDINLPRELFTRKNVLKIYDYVLEHIQLPDAPPYSFHLGGDEVMEILENKSN